jgi:uncharacterized membrane protein
MTVVRRAWMLNMAGRENRFLDSQLMGHVINSASFFASANLIIIAAAAGALFGGDTVWRSVRDIAIMDQAPRWLFDAKLAVVILCLARGLLDFIWSLRQMNYCIAAFGAAPERAPRSVLTAYGEAVSSVLNPAVSSFNAGVRGYYFALAGAAWLLGPWALLAATIGAMSLLFWRQRRSPAASGIRTIRTLLETIGDDPSPPRASDKPRAD